jgi:hypothetical protein
MIVDILDDGYIKVLTSHRNNPSFGKLLYLHGYNENGLGTNWSHVIRTRANACREEP